MKHDLFHFHSPPLASRQAARLRIATGLRDPTGRVQDYRGWMRRGTRMRNGFFIRGTRAARAHFNWVGFAG